MENTKSSSYYDDACMEWFEQNDSPLRRKRLVNLIELNKEFTVADFGCGTGMMMEHVAPFVKEYVGVDFALPFIKKANEKKERMNMHNVHFVCSSIDDFCTTYTNHFDVGLATDVSEHIDDSQWLPILMSIYNSLKYEGKLYIHTPNAEFLLEIMKSHNFLVRQIGGHIAVRTPSHNIDLLRQAGFSSVTIRLLPHYNKLRVLHLISFMPWIGKYFKARLFITAVK